MKKRKLPYKTPTIIRNKSGDWYIQYYFENPNQPGKFEPFKVRSGINRIKDPANKEREARVLRKDVEDWLSQGNSPHTQESQVLQQIIAKQTEISQIKELAKKKNWTIVEAIGHYRKFIKGNGYSPRTLETYKGYLDDIEEAFADSPLAALYAKDLTEYDVAPLIENMFQENEWQTRTYNNYIGFTGTLFNKCNKLERAVDRTVKYLFDSSNLDPKITKPQKNKAYSPVLAAKIKKELNRPGNENLRDYIQFIYTSLMRPKEIRHLKIEDINQNLRQIRIVGKSGDRLVPIPDQLLSLLNKRKVFEYPANFYVFGRAGAVSGERMSKEYFSGLYGTIKNKLNLSADYTPYSWKPTGVQDLILAGFEDKAIMALTGHKTQKAFEEYKRDFIIDNSHLMKGRTIDF